MAFFWRLLIFAAPWAIQALGSGSISPLVLYPMGAFMIFAGLNVMFCPYREDGRQKVFGPFFWVAVAVGLLTLKW